MVSRVTMSSPTVVLNNLIQEEDTTYIDPVSKTYLIGEVFFGLNRLGIFHKLKSIFLMLASVYSILLCGSAFYAAFFYQGVIYNTFMGIDSIKYVFGVIVSSLVSKRLQHYFRKLQEFDMTVGCRPKIAASCVKNLIQMGISMVLVFLSVCYEWYMSEGQIFTVFQLPVRFLFIMDIHFYGHLLSLLVLRLRLINYYMKISLSEQTQVIAPKVDALTFKSVILETQNCQMKKLMDLYCIIITAYDILIDAIKWQFVMVLTATFVSILSFSYGSSLSVIRATRPFINVATEFAFTSVRLFPLFSPCVFGDQIREEVRRLRELLASRLYENKLNKPGRSVARALLALTEARDLSFSLLQIFDIDISLPFKFLGLLLTYLIILLQFEKVINP